MPKSPDPIPIPNRPREEDEAPPGRSLLRFLKSPFKLALWALVLFFAGGPAWKFATVRSSWAFEPDAQAAIVGGEGNVLITWPESGDRIPVKFDELPENMVHAAMAREDQRFFGHIGIDPVALVRAAIVDIKSGKIDQGASTITMQLVERVYEYPQKKTLDKVRAKIFEVMMAPRLELYAARTEGSRRAGKEAILASYLSRVEYGHRTVGIREAAFLYFGKKPSGLTLGESAYLAGLIRGPSVNNAYRNPDNARLARDAVIANMEELDLVDSKMADKVAFYVSSTPHRRKRKGDGFTSAAVRRELHGLIQAGDLDADFADSGRLRIHLGVERDVQKLAEESLMEQLRKIETDRRFSGRRGILQGAVVVIDNATGAILASVGGRDFDQLSYDCALQASRTVASASKPFLYACLLEQHGIGPGYEILNTSLEPFEAKTYSGPRAPHETTLLKQGRHPLWKGLAFSSNRMTLRVGAHAGQRRWTRLLRDTGLSVAPPRNDTAEWLGSFGVKLVDLAAAYAVFPREGYYTDPYMIRRIEKDGRTIYRRKPRPKRVLAADACRDVTESLRETLRVGTVSGRGGKALAEKIAVAGKTGTSDDVADAWFVGYGSDVTVAVWIGFPEGNRTILKDEGGNSLAFPVWKKIVNEFPDHYEWKSLPELEKESKALNST